MIKIKNYFRCKKLKLLIAAFIFFSGSSEAQRLWVNVDSLYEPLPASAHVFRSEEMLDGKPFIAYYFTAPLKDKGLIFTTDTSSGRRLKPSEFFVKNNNPLLVVNTTFFSYETNRSINVVVKNKKLVGYNVTAMRSKGKDSMTAFFHPLSSAIGIDRKRNADVAWCFTDSAKQKVMALQSPVNAIKDSNYYDDLRSVKKNLGLRKWKMQTAVGGGPVLVQQGKVAISNDEEKRFAGKAKDDKHPRTLMGYTYDGKIIIMVIQGRFNGLAEGASLEQEARLMTELGCVEALNLDGGGSSCMLINGKETIKPSDKEGQRGVPSVFVVKVK